MRLSRNCLRYWLWERFLAASSAGCLGWGAGSRQSERQFGQQRRRTTRSGHPHQVRPQADSGRKASTLARFETTIKRVLRSRWTLPLLAAIFALWLAWTMRWQIGLGLPGDMNFYLHSGKYQRIVTKIKAQHLARGQKVSEQLEGDDVVAERSGSGSYTLTIITQDWDHAGIYGYVFSDTPLTVQPDANYPGEFGIDNPGRMPFVDKAIAGQGRHWWSVYDNLE